MREKMLTVETLSGHQCVHNKLTGVVGGGQEKARSPKVVQGQSTDKTRQRTIAAACRHRRY